MNKNEYQIILENEFQCRLAKNAAYSMRSFARDLAISPSALSEIISGKRGLSVLKASSLVNQMDLPVKNKDIFIDSVKSTKARYKNKTKKNHSQFLQIQMDNFTVISDWYHFAILNLTKLEQFESNTNWIANRLGITEEETDKAIERLVRLSLLEKIDGQYKRVEKTLRTSEDVPSNAIKAHHKQILNKALLSVDNHTVKERALSATTIAIKKDKLDLAKQKIKKFREDMTECLGDEKAERIYNLNIQFIPMDQEEDIS